MVMVNMYIHSEINRTQKPVPVFSINCYNNADFCFACAICYAFQNL